MVGDVARAGDLVVAVLHWTGSEDNGAKIERDAVEAIRMDAQGLIAEHWGIEVRCQRREA